MKKVLKKRSWKVHTIAECEDCDWRTEDYKNGQGIAAIHAKLKGHRVHGEVEIAFEYQGKIN